MPNDPKLSDGGVRRGTCMACGKAAVEAGAVTHGAVRCSAWLGVARVAFVVKGRLQPPWREVLQPLSFTSFGLRWRLSDRRQHMWFARVLGFAPARRRR